MLITNVNWQMDLIERFKYIMKLNNMNASTFAEAIGVQPSSVSHILTGRNKPSLEFIQKILERFPKVDASWLINGKLNLLPKEEDRIQEKDKLSLSDGKSITQEKEHPTPLKSDVKKEIVRILVFYTDNTFEEFNAMPKE